MKTRSPHTSSERPGPTDAQAAAVEEALSSEPLRPVPENLHRDITHRLRIAALVQRERRRVRYALTMTGVAATAMALCTGVFAVLADVPGMLRYGVPGGRGYLDYVTTYLTLSWPGAATSLTLVVTPIVALVVLMTLLPSRRLLAGRASLDKPTRFLRRP